MSNRLKCNGWKKFLWPQKSGASRQAYFCCFVDLVLEIQTKFSAHYLEYDSLRLCIRLIIRTWVWGWHLCPGSRAAVAVCSLSANQCDPVVVKAQYFSLSLFDAVSTQDFNENLSGPSLLTHPLQCFELWEFTFLEYNITLSRYSVCIWNWKIRKVWECRKLDVSNIGDYLYTVDIRQSHC